MSQAEESNQGNQGTADDSIEWPVLRMHAVLGQLADTQKI